MFLLTKGKCSLLFVPVQSRTLFRMYSISTLSHNGEVVEQWLRDLLVPNLSKNSVIIMGTVHVIQVDKCQVQSTKKDRFS